MGNKAQNKLVDSGQCLAGLRCAPAVLETALMGFPDCSWPGGAAVRSQPELETRWSFAGGAEVYRASGGTALSCGEVLLSGPFMLL